MKGKIFLLSLFSCLFLAAGGSLEAQAFAANGNLSERMKAFFNGDRSATILQCYQVAIPNGWEAKNFLVWLDSSEETGFSQSEAQDDIICFVLNPGEVKWIFTTMKRTGSFGNNGVFDIKYDLCLKTILYSNGNNPTIDVHKKKAPMMI